MITKLDIENFKNFKKLNIKDLRQISLISGKNNIGKTTILEAILLLHSCQQSSFLVPILGNRLNNNSYVTLKFEHAVTPLFNKYKKENEIIIRSDNDQMLMKVIQDADLIVQQNNVNNLITTSLKTEGLNIRYKHKLNDYFEGVAAKNIIQQDTYLPFQSSILHNVNIPPVVLINEFGELVKANDVVSYNYPHTNKVASRQEALVREFNNIKSDHRELISGCLMDGLKLLSSSITDVEFGLDFNNDPRIELIIDGRAVPLSSFGNGMKRLFSIIIGVISAKDGILLIDEIENGIHYSIINEMWNLIFKLASDNNCQIIGTTHSFEFASYVTKQPSTNHDLFSFINISTLKEDNLASETYNFSEFSYAVENNSEIR